MNRNCIQTRKIILETSEVELLTPELKTAKDHLQKCGKCESFFAHKDSFREFIKENIEVIPTPPIVRENTLQMIAKLYNNNEENRNSFSFFRKRNLYKYSAIAAVILISILLFLYNPFDTGKPDLKLPGLAEPSASEAVHPLTEELVNDYIRYRLSKSPVEFATNSPHELNNWFNGKVDFNVRFSSFNNMQLVGGRLCYLFERRVALAFYKNPGITETGTNQLTSLFIFSERSFGKDNHIDISTMRTVELNNFGKLGEVKIICKDESKGYELALWKQSGLVYAMVSDTDVLKLINEIN